MSIRTLIYHPRAHGHLVEDLRREIERRAFERYLERVHEHGPGSPEDDWFAAEAEVCAEHGITPPRRHPVV